MRTSWLGGWPRRPARSSYVRTGQVGLETVLAEIDKLTSVRQLGLPGGLFTDASEKLVAAWRARAMRSHPSGLRESPREVWLTLLAALCWMRQSEIADALVDLLIELVHKINTKAERKVECELRRHVRRHFITRGNLRPDRGSGRRG
ncbi:hypothetical protein DFQ14_102323 [Halopolyspora algeriensis]|uniref:Uncharacterized protein n=1 Tax=Halopolyspora algeriensis TaxID=1500506 RepID=A0A368W0B6_9ACTN|nr:hypothetical protein DFQ14_102323 [Halopolyspora algeriensis]